MNHSSTFFLPFSSGNALSSFSFCLTRVSLTFILYSPLHEPHSMFHSYRVEGRIDQYSSGTRDERASSPDDQHRGPTQGISEPRAKIAFGSIDCSSIVARPPDHGVGGLAVDMILTRLQTARDGHV
ncbi:hypothetical protein NM688_g2414 [Phlebia brevispora]|uniref:Uncharacterized protein n=1 Tax=Phlebia brevispora TaxID=194682 RepID=A0ACC1T8J7_9APHY|nr:hypothetical protein NM688_g2414 [Phlebia brevispora]